jgi:hypothetical protein
LAQEMSSVIHYLPCFGEWLITHLLSVFTVFPVFVYLEFMLRLALCSSPFLWCTFSVPPVPSVVLDYSLLFVTQFCWGGISLPRGCAGLWSWGGWGRSTWCVCSLKSWAGRFGAGSSSISEKWLQIFSE